MARFNRDIVIFGTNHAASDQPHKVYEAITDMAKKAGAAKLAVFIELVNTDETNRTLKSMDDASIDSTVESTIVPEFTGNFKLLLKELRKLRDNHSVEFSAIDMDTKSRSPADYYADTCNDIHRRLNEKSTKTEDFDEAVKTFMRSMAVLKFCNEIRDNMMVERIADKLDDRFDIAFVIVGRNHLSPIAEALKKRGNSVETVAYLGETGTESSSLDRPLSEVAAKYVTLNKGKIYKIGNNFRRVSINLENGRNLLRTTKAGNKIERDVESFLANPKNMAIKTKMDEKDMLMLAKDFILSSVELKSRARFADFVHSRDLEGLKKIWNALHANKGSNALLRGNASVATANMTKLKN